MTFPKSLESSNLLGMAASGLCAIHCTLTPLLFAAKPLLEGSAEGHGHEHGSLGWATFDYAFLLLSLLAVWYTARHSDHQRTRSLLWVAWGTFAVGILAEPFELPYGSVLMYAGSLALVALHLHNYRHCKRCNEGACAADAA